MKTRFEHAYVLNVVSRDHPGIVAAVGDVIESLEGNVDSCSQTVLYGHFTLIMIISLPNPVEPADLIAAVRGPADRAELDVVSRVFDPTAADEAELRGERFVITAFGQDTPGVLHRFSQYLAGKDINIVDLYGDRTGGDFVLISEVDIPAKMDTVMLQADLEEMGQEMGFTTRLQHENVFVATNQLRLTRQERGA